MKRVCTTARQARARLPFYFKEYPNAVDESMIIKVTGLTRLPQPGIYSGGFIQLHIDSSYKDPPGVALTNSAIPEEVERRFKENDQLMITRYNGRVYSIWSNDTNCPYSSKWDRTDEVKKAIESVNVLGYMKQLEDKTGQAIQIKDLYPSWRRKNVVDHPNVRVLKIPDAPKMFFHLSSHKTWLNVNIMGIHPELLRGGRNDLEIVATLAQMHYKPVN